jgi:hypothetical protein
MVQAPNDGDATGRHAHASGARSVLLLVVACSALAGGWQRLVGEVRPAWATPPVVVHVDRDAAWRLRMLPGIGYRRAADIVWDREINDPPTHLEDLRRIEGISTRILRGIADARAVRVWLAGRRVE